MKKLFISASTCITFLVGQCSSAEEMKSAWSIMVRHRALGRIKVLASDNALKVYVLNNQTELVAKAPDWHVVISRPSTKIGMEFSLNKWVTKTVGMLDGKPPTPLQYNEKPILENAFGTPVLLFNGTAKKTQTRAQYLVLKDKTPAQLNSILIRLYRLPQIDGLPLDYNESSGESYRRGETLWLNSQNKLNESRRYIYPLELKVIKKEKVPAHEFDYPKGFKMTNDERDIMITNGRSEMMNALTNFGVSDISSTTKKK